MSILGEQIARILERNLEPVVQREQLPKVAETIVDELWPMLRAAPPVDHLAQARKLAAPYAWDGDHEQAMRRTLGSIAHSLIALVEAAQPKPRDRSMDDPHFYGRIGD